MLLSAGLLGVILGGCGKKGALTVKSWEPPPSPAGVVAVHREGGITLLWSFPRERQDMLSGFLVSRESPAGTRREFLVPAGDRKFMDGEIVFGETYRYQILASNIRGVMSTGSGPISATPLQPPAPPQRLAAEVRGNSVVLTWDGSPGDVYNVYRRSGDQPYGLSPVNGRPVKAHEFTDILNVQARESYAVRASLGTEIRDEGALSQEVVIDPRELVPPAPRRATAHAMEDRIVITWDEAEESWVSGYRIYRRLRGREYAPAGETQIPSFIDTDASSGPRDYRVTALGPAREGPAAELSGISLLPSGPK